MKKVAFMILIFAIFYNVHGQLLKFGIRGGVSSTQVKLSDAINIVSNLNDTLLLNLASNTPMGFHFGGFMQIGIAGVFIQPEVLLATTGGEVKIENASSQIVRSAKQRDLRIDVPVLVGMKLGPARLGTGPIASFNLLTKDEIADIVSEFAELEESTTAETVFKKAVWGWQVGAGLNIFGKIALDVKYEFGLSKLGDGINLGDQRYNFSKKANQAIFSVGYMF